MSIKERRLLNLCEKWQSLAHEGFLLAMQKDGDPTSYNL